MNATFLPNAFEKGKAGWLFSFWSITHKLKLNEPNPLLFLRIVRHCAFFNRYTDLPITTNKINDIGIVPNYSELYVTDFLGHVL